MQWYEVVKAEIKLSSSMIKAVVLLSDIILFTTGVHKLKKLDNTALTGLAIALVPS